MSKKTDLGVYIKENKTFYYLEYGENYVGNTLDRVRKALIQRNLIQPSLTSSRSQPYEIMSKKEAFDASLDMIPIYISKHIQNLNKINEKPLGGNFK